MQVLVTGGAGYIGSHMVRLLHGSGHQVVVLDSLLHGHREAVPAGVDIVVGNVGTPAVLNQLFSRHHFTAVIHFAGLTQVGESVRYPRKYFQSNLLLPTRLLQTMVKHGVLNLIFSSTAAVYGNPDRLPIPEDHVLNPTNPYGLSKAFFEQLLGYYDRKFHLRSVSLRYFNAAGAALDGTHGENHLPETHIIPLAISSVLAPTPVPFRLFGTDYPTSDGTCVRDYIHIEDLCRVHLLALNALQSGHPASVYNVGSGTGYTNRQVLDMVMQVTRREIPLLSSPRRPGDPDALIADPARIKSAFGWQPVHSSLSEIVTTAWKWHSTHPRGYPA